MRLLHTILAITVTFLYTGPVKGIVISTAVIGSFGNAGDTQPGGIFGAVGYEYRIGKTEVTNTQYVEFLNSVASSDPYELYNSRMASDLMGGIVRNGVEGAFEYFVKEPVPGEGIGGVDYTFNDKPVTYVSWYDAVRFANWLHNGQGNADTENGAYLLVGGTPVPSNAETINRNGGAKWWLPSEDEWYKAAYYDPTKSEYNDYPTGQGAPDNNIPALDTGNSANFLRDLRGLESDLTTGNRYYTLTDAGAYQVSPSPFGTFDQGGNLAEWNETVFQFTAPLRGIRGGNWSFTVNGLAASSRGSGYATDERGTLGFRMAMIVPESSTLMLGLMSIAGFVLWRR